MSKAKQSWEAGQQVKVGFLAGLTVIAKIPTPGAPDAYVLVRGEQFYSFMPHNGISKIDHAEARDLVAQAKRVRAAAECPRRRPGQPRHRHRQARRRAAGCLSGD
ncbi:hypothetical protein [Cupriavidus basilensis]